MSKACPLSMSGQSPKLCITDRCNGWINGECYLNRETLSKYYTAKNLDSILYEINQIRQTIERNSQDDRR